MLTGKNGDVCTYIIMPDKSSILRKRIKDLIILKNQKKQDYN
ncbi:MAG TPA: hypothetical protein PLL66_02645 [Bacteroidales bacterium]|nr:hypothetical protein [Bacteroidales bacterium]